MACKESKANQKQKQVRDENPFMREMREEACEPRAFNETGTQKLLHCDDAETNESGSQRMTMKDRDAGERGGEKQKIDQHGEIVSAEIRGDGHVCGFLPVSLSIQEAGTVRLSVSISVGDTKRTICCRSLIGL